MQKKFNILFFCFLFNFLFVANLHSNENISIIGNRNISNETIYSFAPKNNEILDPDSINTYQKKLFNTGFFESVEISIKNKKLLVKVIENPLINFFFIDGVKNKEVNNNIYEIVKNKENSIFQPHLIKEDISNISKLLNNLGYLNNKIDYQLIKIKNNKVNIFYNIELNNKFKINRIFFIGNKYFKSSVLSDVVYSTEYGWWKFLSNTSIPTEQIVDADINRLKNFYEDNGFYDVQINSNSINIIDDKFANIVYSINAGSKYIVNKIEIIDKSSLLKPTNLNYLNKLYTKLINKHYSKSDIQRMQNLSSEYLSSSNLNVIIEKNDEKIDSGKININFIIYEQKNKKLIEKITIIGNNITDEFVVRNNLSFAEGDYLNSNFLKSSITKLKGNGLFKNVTTDTIPINSNSEKIELIIKVEEQATGEISAGAGAGTNGASISGAIREKNFIGKGLGLNANINFGTQKIYGNIGYTNPDFRNTGKSLNTSFFAETNDFENASYENKIIGSSIATYYEVFDKIFLNPGLSVDFDKVKANPDASTIIKKREGSYYTSKLFYNISKNTKNRDFLPSEGYVFGAGQGFSILSEIPYINNKIFGSYYNEYLENFIGSVRYKIETINGFDKDIKFSDRLFVGSNNLRGFSNRGIGPKIDGDFIGGNYSYYGTVSTTIPNGMPEKWNATTNIFFDTANVWGVDDNSTDDSSKLRSSVGMGFSWVSPIGPISFTYAQPISKASTDDVEQFNFKIGSAF